MYPIAWMDKKQDGNNHGTALALCCKTYLSLKKVSERTGFKMF